MHGSQIIRKERGKEKTQHFALREITCAKQYPCLLWSKLACVRGSSQIDRPGNVGFKSSRAAESAANAISG
jgi:hypothetical protein